MIFPLPGSFFPGPVSLKLLTHKFVKSQMKDTSFTSLNYLWIELDNKYLKQLLATCFFVSIVPKVYLILPTVLKSRRESHIFNPFYISDLNTSNLMSSVMFWGQKSLLFRTKTEKHTPVISQIFDPCNGYILCTLLTVTSITRKYHSN